VSPPLWLGGYGAAAIVLAVGGGAKAARPAATARALREFGVPAPVAVFASPVAVRAGGAAEVVVAGAALVAGGRWPAAVIAVSYLAFAVVVALAAKSRSPLTSCGCFGEVDAPPTAAHAAVNFGIAAIAASVLATRTPPAALLGGGIRQVAAGHPLVGAVFLLLTAVVAYLAYLVMAVLPQTVATARALHPPQPDGSP
jgi:hypothetical protein